MPGPVFVSGDRLTLRPVEPADHEFLDRHANRESIRRWIGGNEPRSVDDLAGWFESDSTVAFLPCRDGEPVGCLWLFDIDDVASRGEVGYWIVEDEQGKGYATEALSLLVRYAVEDRGLEKLLARVFEGNEASMRVLEKAGFEREGRLRDHDWVGGERVDTVLFGQLTGARRPAPGGE